MAANELVEIEGHIIDSLILAKVLDVIVTSGGDYRIVDVDIGRSSNDLSRARLDVMAADEPSLEALLIELQVHGANRVDQSDARLVPADRDGVFPTGFYSTTNLPTSIRQGGRWLAVDQPEMDCGLVVNPDGVVRAVPMHRIVAGDAVVVGHEGIRVQAPSRQRHPGAFEFMGSDASSEKPKGLLVQGIAARIRRTRDRRSKVLAVCGPAVIHTGAGADVARLVEAGWIDVLFAGNGFATHDLESNVLGTSLGISVGQGGPVEGGHANHLRVINEIRRKGSIAAAVESGYVTGGVMYECVRRGMPFVLGGSVRDDGPLPDVITDVVDAADAMRALIPGVGLALILASTLHAIATGNLMPAWVETYCIDINQAVVTKLADRGSHQAVGVVTDVGLFVHELTKELCGDGGT